MTTKEKLLKDFIKEELSASDARQLVGDYLWPLRSKNPPKSKDDPRYEIDTPDEERLYDAFVSFVMNHQKAPMTSKTLETLYDLQQLGLYNDVLSKPPKKPVYRGISVGTSWFQRNFGISYRDFFIKSKSMKKARESVGTRGFDDWYLIDMGSRDITPSGEGVMSWTKSFNKAAMFASGMGFSGASYNVPIIFEALPSENKLVDISFIYNLDYSKNFHLSDQMKDRQTEQEVLSIGPIIVSKVFCGIWQFGKEGKLQPIRFVPAERFPGRKKTVGLPSHVNAEPEETDADFEKLGHSDIPKRR